MHRAAARIDVHAVRFVADDLDLGSKLAQHGRRDLVCRTVGAIDHQFDALKIQVFGQRPLDEFDVPSFGIVDPECLADGIGSGTEVGNLIGHDQFFDSRLDFIWKFEPVVRKKLDAVILIGIMGCRDHDAGIGPETPCEKCDRRCRQWPHQKHVDPHGADARHQRGFQHIAGHSRILSDHDLMTPGPAHENVRSGTSQLHRSLAGHRLQISRTPDTICAEELTHVVPALQPTSAARSRRRHGPRLSSVRHRAHAEYSHPARPPEPRPPPSPMRAPQLRDGSAAR